MTAREVYEAVTSRLLYVTAAAWVRWDDLMPEQRQIWESAHEAVARRYGLEREAAA